MNLSANDKFPNYRINTFFISVVMNLYTRIKVLQTYLGF